MTDEFMRAVLDDKDWTTHWVTNPNKPGPTYKARELMRGIAEGRGFVAIPVCSMRIRSSAGTPARTPRRSVPATRAARAMFLDNLAPAILRR